MSRLSDLIEQVGTLNPELAKELNDEVSEYAKRRPFGLNFERHTPESVRLWNRPVRLGDYVNVLPPRGGREMADSHVLWRVVEIDDDGKTAHLMPAVENKEEQSQGMLANMDDLVVVARFKDPIYPGLKETGRVERGGDKPYQVVINGENFHALETLMYPYEGKVDCIYIDPPYNTGAKDWKYNNDYVDGNDQYAHSKWLAMMERRLKLAKRLLNPEKSVLICTIDEKEVHRLALLLEQIFPAAHIQMVSININPAAVARNNEFGRSDEYACFVMQGDAGPEKLELNSDWVTSKGRTHTGHIRKDLFRRSGSNSERRHSPGCFYPIYINKDRIVSVGQPVPPGADRNLYIDDNGLTPVFPIRKNGSEGVWMGGVDTAQDLLNRGYLWIGKYAGERTPIYYYASGEIKKIESGTYPLEGYDNNGVAIIGGSDETGFRSVPSTQWRIPGHDSTQYGSRLLLNFFDGEKRFSYPKSLYAEEDTLRFFVADKADALILDFFAGSGTTAHAVMRLNHQDGGHRRCICVTNNEVSDDEAKRFTKRGLRQGDPEWEAHGICEYVTKPRVKAAITGLTPEGEPIKGDYKFTDEFPMADGFEENAIFFDLTYQDEMMVELDQVFEEIAPLLWMRAGSEGRIIKDRRRDFDISEHYAILFNYAYASKFLDAIQGKEGLRVVYVVTDQDSRFQDVVRALPKGIEPVRLYESYLRSFRFSHGEV